MNIGILGAGSWGTALSVLLYNNKHTVTLWEFREEASKRLSETRENKDFLPGIQIPPEIQITSELDLAVSQKDFLLIMLPSHVVRSVAVQIARYPIGQSIIVSGSKGIENNTLQ